MPVTRTKAFTFMAALGRHWDNLSKGVCGPVLVGRTWVLAHEAHWLVYEGSTRLGLELPGGKCTHSRALLHNVP